MLAFPFFRRARAKAENTPARVDDDDVTQILVRLGKLSAFALTAMMTLSRAKDDEELVQQLVQRRVVSRQDVEIARQVQSKLRAGQPIYEEWAKLEAIMAENKRCAQELTAVISETKARRRKQGEDSVMFVAPRHLRSAT
jgi:multidrug resistance efflux pump